MSLIGIMLVILTLVTAVFAFIFLNIRDLLIYGKKSAVPQGEKIKSLLVASFLGLVFALLILGMLIIYMKESLISIDW